MKEYGIYIRHGNGKPFMIHIYNNLDSAKFKLYDILRLEEERQRPYFVDNDFYNNKYSNVSKLSYYCIKVREVSEWVSYSEEKELENKKDNIIYFQNFKKQLTN